jgi:hypothetical protein
MLTDMGSLIDSAKAIVGAAPIVFGPCTLGRTWGTRPISFGRCYGTDSYWTPLGCQADSLVYVRAEARTYQPALS